MSNDRSIPERRLSATRRHFGHEPAALVPGVMERSLETSLPVAGTFWPMRNLDEVNAAAATLRQRWSDRNGAGFAAAVVVDDAVVWSAGLGSASLPAGRPMHVDTICYVGSVAKQFTAAVVILAALDGHLELTDRVRRWVPELPDFCEDISLDDLLHHTSGLRDYFGYRSLHGSLPDHTYDPNALLTDLSRQDRLNFAVGERFGYSNTNYVLLTVVAERATGTPFAEFARSRIFEPLGMNDSCFHSGTRPSGDRVARAYDRTIDGKWIENDPVLGVLGDGGMRSTVTDLVRWMTSGMGGALDARLGPLLAERRQLPNGQSISYGRGVGHRIRGGRHCLQHGGGLGAWRAIVAWYPDDHTGAVVLANAGDVDPLRAALAITEPVLPGIKPEPARHPIPERLLGLWIDDDQGIVLDITGDAYSAVMTLWGSPIPLNGDGEGGAVAASVGLRLTVAEVGTEVQLHVDDNGDPWGAFRRAIRSDASDATRYAGRYRSTEFASEWNLIAENDHLRIEHLADDLFAPATAGVYTSGATTLRFTTDEPDPTPRLTVDMARTSGFAFVRSP
jgi:CubicO group peptidase (beta-lactamase class C family)